MGEMRDSDWSRQILLRSDWLLPIGAIMTTNFWKSKIYLRLSLLQSNAPTSTHWHPTPDTHKSTQPQKLFLSVLETHA